MDELQPEDPRRIGPYRLEERLGSGGMGRVYLGRSPGGRRVAIKVIRPELAEDADFRARFAREVSAARKVSGMTGAIPSSGCTTRAKKRNARPSSNRPVSRVNS